MLSRSEREGARPNEVRELAALLRSEQGVDSPERFDERVTKALGRFDPLPRDRRRFGLVERVICDGIGKSSGAPPMVDGRLRALRLQIAEDTGELTHLTVVETEFVREKPERPPHTERPSAKVTVVIGRGGETRFPVAAFRWSAAGRPAAGRGAPSGTTRMSPPIEHCRMHFELLSPGLSLPIGGFSAGPMPRASGQAWLGRWSCQHPVATDPAGARVGAFRASREALESECTCRVCRSSFLRASSDRGNTRSPRAAPRLSRGRASCCTSPR